MPSMARQLECWSLGNRSLEGVYLNSDIYIYLEADRDLQEVGQKEAYLSAVVTYLEKVLREINNRNWNIRNAIEWKKFIHGE